MTQAFNIIPDNGLDRYGLVVDQNWYNSSGSTIHRLQYGFDADGNALYRDNMLSSTNSELYTDDAGDRLSSFKRGTLGAMRDDRPLA